MRLKFYLATHAARALCWRGAKIICGLKAQTRSGDSPFAPARFA